MKNNQECEIIRTGLMDFLERKRGKFPRLFFLSNEELIEIFGKGVELVETMIEGGSQGFVSNLFEGVDTLRFHEITYEVTNMLSKDGEELHLVKEVGTRNMTVDSWLKLFETSMTLTVKDALFLTFEQMGLQDAEEWVSEWPGQATFLAS
jgi:dynein heavy chain